MIPQIQLLCQFEPLRSVLKIDIFPPVKGTTGFYIDFFDIKTSDRWCDEFQTK